MKNKVPGITWGIILVLIGLALAGRAFDLFYFNIFFNGWWTLFIIIPCAINMLEKGKRISSLIGLGTGLLLLLLSQGFITWDMFVKLIISIAFIGIGLGFVFKSNKKDNNSNYEDADNSYNNSTMDNHDSKNNGGVYQQNKYEENNYQQDTFQNGAQQGRTQQNKSFQFHSNQKEAGNSNINHYTGILGGQNVQFVDEVFSGAIINSILGNVQLDLRNAIFIEDAKIELTCILGGVDIFIPSNLRVVVNCTPILAGVESKIILPYDIEGVKHTLFINGTCILGGIEIK